MRFIILASKDTYHCTYLSLAGLARLVLAGFCAITSGTFLPLKMADFTALAWHHAPFMSSIVTIVILKFSLPFYCDKFL